MKMAELFPLNEYLSTLNMDKSNEEISSQIWLKGDCDFTSFSTLFQLYQDDVKVIMKG